MKKSDYFKIILSVLVLSLLVNVLFGRYIAAKISTLPLLNRWKIVSPLAPIVMTSKEVVRVSETGDILQVVNNTKPKLSTVFQVGDGSVKVLGGSNNLTAEGLFLTTKSVVEGVPADQLYVKTNDGTTAKVLSVLPDPATNLVLLKADLKNLGVITLGDSGKLQAGEKLIFLASSAMDYSANFVQTSVYSSQQEVLNKISDSDHPSRTFGAQSAGALIPGEAVVNLSGEVIGIWDGRDIISSDVVRGLTNTYFNNNQAILRPMFGFEYRTITPVEAKLLNLPEGASVQKITLPKATGAAAGQGLEVGDVITAVNDAKLSSDTQLESLLQKYKPGDQVVFTVSRGSGVLKVTVAPQALK